MKPQLYVRQDKGNGKPIVLLHGMFGDGTQWEKIAELLQKDFRVIVVDLLGHGRSPRPAHATYSDKEHVAALRNTLTSLGALQDATIVGYSMGGSVALAYSSTYPDSVEQLYLISTPFYLQPEQMIPNKYAGSILFTKASTGLFSVLEKLLHKGGSFERIVKFGNSSKKFHQMIGANDNELEVEIIRKNLHQLVHTFDFVGHLKKLKAPLTFYAGKKDVFVVQTQLNALRQFCPLMDIQRLDIIKIDHMLVQNLPNEMAKLLLKNAQNQLSVPVDKGNGKTLLLIHGVESSSDYWISLIEPLSQKYRVIAVDLLGFGQSPKPLNVGYTLQDQVTWLQRTLEKHSVGQVEILAHSLGCLVALTFAAQNPNRVKKMTFLAPVFVPDKRSKDNHIISRLDYINQVSDGSLLQTQASQVVGYQQIAKYLPFVRTVQNAIRNQNAQELAERAKNTPLNIVYGSKDSLIDKSYLTKVSRHFKQVSVTSLPGKRHNFALFEPTTALQYVLDGDISSVVIKKPNKLPPTFTKQLLKMAAPMLMLKSVLYIASGALLFTYLAPWVITLGLAFFVIRLGAGYIQGAFSLRNEALSYVGYVLLGISALFIGLALVRRPELSLAVSSFIIAGLVLLAGLTRLLVALAWVKQKTMQKSLLLSGGVMTLVGIFALCGGIVSTKIIVYTLAVLLILRGIRFALSAAAAISFAYMRGFAR